MNEDGVEEDEEKEEKSRTDGMEGNVTGERAAAAATAVVTGERLLQATATRVDATEKVLLLPTTAVRKSANDDMISVTVYVCLYVCMCVCVRMCVRMCVRACVRVCVCVLRGEIKRKCVNRELYNVYICLIKKCVRP